MRLSSLLLAMLVSSPINYFYTLYKLAFLRPVSHRHPADLPDRITLVLRHHQRGGKRESDVAHYSRRIRLCPALLLCAECACEWLDVWQELADA